jgi:hypothetical protein
MSSRRRNPSGVLAKVRIPGSSGHLRQDGPNLKPRSDEEPVPQPPSAEAIATSERFFGHGLLPIALYQPDYCALEVAPARVIVGGGTTSRGQFAWRTAVALADRIGTPVIDFPGGHGGFASDAKDFAAVLRRILA